MDDGLKCVDGGTENAAALEPATRIHTMKKIRGDLIK
jgi:hypothetical protein